MKETNRQKFEQLLAAHPKIKQYCEINLIGSGLDLFSMLNSRPSSIRRYLQMDPVPFVAYSRELEVALRQAGLLSPSRAQDGSGSNRAVANGEIV